ncbi:hypothetical protein TrispH2_002687 [Trichoplax sp. H2]|nr:hypothetical protein TrispH2_002687 [Trichoplax sp. H2]|eukprot:RDD45431.1 hypothetical protein TrispH2_002687 [Trichoplax sp. H2]
MAAPTSFWRASYYASDDSSEDELQKSFGAQASRESLQLGLLFQGKDLYHEIDEVYRLYQQGLLTIDELKLVYLELKSKYENFVLDYSQNKQYHIQARFIHDVATPITSEDTDVDIEVAELKQKLVHIFTEIDRSQTLADRRTNHDDDNDDNYSVELSSHDSSEGSEYEEKIQQAIKALSDDSSGISEEIPTSKDDEESSRIKQSSDHDMNAENNQNQDYQTNSYERESPLNNQQITSADEDRKYGSSEQSIQSDKTVKPFDQQSMSKDTESQEHQVIKYCDSTLINCQTDEENNASSQNDIKSNTSTQKLEANSPESATEESFKNEDENKDPVPAVIHEVESQTDQNSQINADTIALEIKERNESVSSSKSEDVTTLHDGSASIPGTLGQASNVVDDDQNRYTKLPIPSPSSPSDDAHNLNISVVQHSLQSDRNGLVIDDHGYEDDHVDIQSVHINNDDDNIAFYRKVKDRWSDISLDDGSIITDIVWNATDGISDPNDPIQINNQAEDNEVVDQSVLRQEMRYLRDDLRLNDDFSHDIENNHHRMKSLNSNLISMEKERTDRFELSDGDQYHFNYQEVRQPYARRPLDSTEVMIDDRSITKENRERSFNSSINSCFNDYYPTLQPDPEAIAQSNYSRNVEEDLDRPNSPLLPISNILTDGVNKLADENIFYYSNSKLLSDQYITSYKYHRNDDPSFLDSIDLASEDVDQAELMSEHLPDFSDPALLARDIIARQMDGSNIEIGYDSFSKPNDNHKILAESSYLLDVSNRPSPPSNFPHRNADITKSHEYGDEIHYNLLENEKIAKDQDIESINADIRNRRNLANYHIDENNNFNESQTINKNRNGVDQRNEEKYQYSRSSSSNFYRSDPSVSSSINESTSLSDDVNTVNSSNNNLYASNYRSQDKSLWRSSPLLNIKTKYINDLIEELYLSDYSDSDDDYYRWSHRRSKKHAKSWQHRSRNKHSRHSSNSTDHKLMLDNDYNYSTSKDALDDDNPIHHLDYSHKHELDEYNYTLDRGELSQDHQVAKLTSSSSRLEREIASLKLDIEEMKRNLFWS